MGLAERDEAAAFGVFAERDGGAYVDLVVEADGTARIRRASGRCPTVELDPASKGQVLRLEISWSPGEAQSVSASVDGREVIECEASSADAPFEFVEAGVLAVAGADHPVTVVVDDFSLFAAS